MTLPLVPWPSSVVEGGRPHRPGPGTRAEALARVLSDAVRIVSPGLAGELGEEGYALRVDAGGVHLRAAAEAGAFYAERTVAQLLTADADGPLVPAVEVRDVPRFRHRGVMLDVARRFHPVETVEALIERAADLKLNALHLHLTDDQGWRLELDSHPELAERGSSTGVGSGTGGRYSRGDFARIVAHAAAHHMTVIPEFDLPGHTHAIGLSHPELAAAPVLSEHVLEVVREHGGGEPTPGEPYTGMAVGFSSLRADAPGLETFLREVIGEIAELTPGPLLHFGGDEALGTSRADYARMVGLASRIVAETGKTPVAWHEAGAADTARGTIGQYWNFVVPEPGHAERARAFVERGGRLILSPADAIYLDMKYDAESPAGLVWANGPTSVRRSYEWEPAAVVPGVAEGGLLGVEAAIWTETIGGSETLERMVFPRIASASEAAWSGPLGSEQRTWQEFRARVAAMAPAWREQGIRFFRSPEIPWAEKRTADPGISVE
ncbi:family 20 glycosylhydrolase [Microbacterium halophytorum]|uniref:family 20 glycosylhydrolase n=1 Tax=Microbacterium halophytorum TaxID=2067568 RepID=UPI001E3F529E|nr:family 20 glycosylhydrolase [Microbacterium halophytorum]